MRSARRFVTAALALGALVALALPAVAGTPATVGGFVRQLAIAKGLNANDAQTALDGLAARGIRLPANLNLGAALTEREVERIARSAGLNVTTSNPEAAFDQEQVNRFFVSFGPELGNGSDDNQAMDEDDGDGPDFDPKSKGKGKGKKKGQETPTEPE